RFGDDEDVAVDDERLGEDLIAPLRRQEGVEAAAERGARHDRGIEPRLIGIPARARVVAGAGDFTGRRRRRIGALEAILGLDGTFGETMIAAARGHERGRSGEEQLGLFHGAPPGGGRKARAPSADVGYFHVSARQVASAMLWSHAQGDLRATRRYSLFRR